MRKITPILGVLTLLLCIPVYASIILIRDTASVSYESVLVNEVAAPAGTAYWRCASYAEVNGNDCEYAVDQSASADCTGAGTPHACCTGSGTGCDESWQSYNDESLCNDENATTLTEEVKIDFATPAASPTASSSAQNIRIRFFKTAATCASNGAGDNPNVDISVYDGSSLIPLATSVACDDDGTGVQEFVYPWTYNGGSDGSEVYVEVFDNGNGLTGTGRRRCSVDYIEWYAETN